MTYKIHRDGDTNSFDDEQEFTEMCDLLDENNVDYTTTEPESVQANPPHDNHGEPVETGTDGGTQIVDHSEGDTSPSVTDVVETGAEANLPDRELTDDPIEWLRQGAGEFTTTIKGTTVITKKGFRVLQHKYDISTSSDVVVGPEDTDDMFCRVKARAEMPDGRYAEAHASAHTDRGDDHFLLVSMADTRAKSRALSDVTGVGAVAIEEMAGVDPE